VNRLPSLAYFIMGVAFLLMGAVLCVVGGTRPNPLPAICFGIVGALIGGAWLRLGVVKRNRSVPR
jgi:hypothetical protein